MTQERLQKFLARCGLASRRVCEQWILAGKVEVNGRTIKVLGTKVDPGLDVVKVDTQRVRPSRQCYFAVHKPKGVVCTHRDPAGRPRVVDLVPDRDSRLFPIGRLDAESEGLILLTNDGDLAQRVAHPRYEVSREYRVEVKGEIRGEQVEKIQKGVWLAEGRTRPARIRIAYRSKHCTTLFLTLEEGMNREVRRILAKIGLPVQRLLRVRVGPIHLGSLKRGRWRALDPKEVVALRGVPIRAVSPGHPSRGSRKPRRFTAGEHRAP